jgi:hypothetical protein
LFVPVVLNDGITYCDTFIANVCPGIIAGRGDELTDYILTFVTERTAEGIVRSGALQADSPKERKIERSLTLITLNKSSISTVFAPESLKRARIVEIFAGRPVARGR